MSIKNKRLLPLFVAIISCSVFAFIAYSYIRYENASARAARAHSLTSHLRNDILLPFQIYCSNNNPNRDENASELWEHFLQSQDNRYLNISMFSFDKNKKGDNNFEIYSYTQIESGVLAKCFTIITSLQDLNYTIFACYQRDGYALYVCSSSPKDIYIYKDFVDLNKEHFDKNLYVDKIASAMMNRTTSNRGILYATFDKNGQVNYAKHSIP